ncbi:acyltransferase [Teratosphaeria destructans]|uniref:Acyltransferase n=1 Tax=Teratosphaeria destructans TaxID=418781 RepID=A0A9W7SVH5_9PEZI|nr:acyltransferase [Teratosphaeria destructans]
MIRWPSVPSGDQLRPTAWLDGLRGFAAFLVYFHHNQAWAHLHHSQNQWFENAWGFHGEYWLSAFHGIRMFFSGGHYAVATFFVISGYVLSTSILRKIHRGDYDGLARNLSSALFRRWIRLFLPVLATTFLWMTSWHALGWCVRPFVRQENYAAELAKWFGEVKNYMFIYDDNPFPWLYWNLHTWSIPFEFRGSMAIYTVTLGLASATKTARIFCSLALMFYFMYMVEAWYLSFFLAGMLICDLDLMAEANDLPLPLEAFRQKVKPHKVAFYTGCFVVSVLLGGVPLANDSFEQFKTEPLWGYIAFLKPAPLKQHKWFYLFWAATLLVISVPRIPWLKAFFNSRFCQYLGRVSYSLYLVHGPLIWTVGNIVYQVVGFEKDGENDSFWNLLPLPKGGPMGFEPAFWIAQLVVMPATFWVANIVTVTMDEPSVRLAKWAFDQIKA